MPVFVARPVVSVVPIPTIEVERIGTCVPTVIWACWLFITTSDGADKIFVWPLVCNVSNATWKFLFKKE